MCYDRSIYKKKKKKKRAHILNFTFNFLLFWFLELLTLKKITIKLSHVKKKNCQKDIHNIVTMFIKDYLIFNESELANFIETKI